jgi:hypothetical protein
LHREVGESIDVKAMERRTMKTNWMQNGVLTVVMAATLFYTSCGTLLYPERRGQCCGRIDPGVAVMDGVGLIFFLIPGVIAFAVDFGTGAIYLPDDDEANLQNGSTDLSDMIALQVDKAELTKPNIEMLVRERTGEDIDLGSSNVVATRIDSQGGK